MGNRPARSAPRRRTPSRRQQEQQAPRSPAKTAPGRCVAAPQSAGEKEIRAFDDLYVRDFNGANAKALAARFTEDAEVIEEDGLRYQGRTLIEERLAETFAASPGAKMAIEIEAIRLLSPDAAKEEGRTIVTPAQGGPATHRRYTALLVKHDGSWLLSSVREEPDPMVSPHDRLAGPRLDARRLDRRGRRFGGPGQLPLVGRPELPHSHVHGQASRART